MAGNIFWNQTATGIRISVHAQPKAKKTEAAGLHGDALKIRIAAPPVDGAANEELVDFFSGAFKIPRSKVEIAVGAGGRRKIVDLVGMTATEFTAAMERLGWRY